jgi:hypothetical protein
MATRRSRAAEFQTPSGADDFGNAIKGIGPGIAQRLYGAGILTFAQLAALSPDEIIARIGNQAGLSTGRIGEEKWIAQAGALAAKKSTTQELKTLEPPPEEQAVENLSAPESPPEDLASRQRYATFTVQLLLGADNSVRRTRVTYVRTESSSEEQESWSGWDTERLLRVIKQQGNLNLPTKQEAATPAPSKAPAPIPPQEPEAAAVLCELALTLSPESEPQRVVPHGQPCRVRLDLDLAGLPSSAARPDAYVVTVRAKRLGSGTRYVLGTAKGAVPAEDRLVVTTHTQVPAAGLYRLEADVDLGSTATAPSQRMQAHLVGGLVYIW